MILQFLQIKLTPQEFDLSIIEKNKIIFIIIKRFKVICVNDLKPT